MGFFMRRPTKYFLLTASIVSLANFMPIKASQLSDQEDSVTAWSVSQTNNKLPAVRLTDKPQLQSARVINDHWGHARLALQHERFTEAYMLGDGNCFYSAMGTTHEAARRLLLAHAHRPDIRYLGHAEIVDEFDHLPQIFHRMANYRAFVEEKQTILAVLAIPDLEEQVRQATRQQQNNLNQRIATWAAEQAVYETYVNHVLKDGHWMMFHEDRPGTPRHTYFVDVLARLMNKRLTIWGQVDHGLNRVGQRSTNGHGQQYIIPLHQYEPGTWDSTSADIIHRENHYNRLVGASQGHRALDQAIEDEARHLASYVSRESAFIVPEGFFCRYQKQLQRALGVLLAGNVLTHSARGKIAAWRQAFVSAHMTQAKVDALLLSGEDEQVFRTVLLRAYALLISKQENEGVDTEDKERALMSSRAILEALKASLSGMPEASEDKIVREASRFYQGLTTDLNDLRRASPQDILTANAHNPTKEALLNEMLTAIGLLRDAMEKEIHDDLKWSYLKKCENAEMSHQKKSRDNAYVNEFSQMQDYSFVREVFDRYQGRTARQVSLNTELLLADPYLSFYNNDISFDPAYRAGFPQERWVPFVDEVTERLVTLCQYERVGTRELLWNTLDKADVATPLGERTRKRYQRILDICLSEAAAQSDSAEESERIGYEAFFLFVSQNRERCIDGLNIAATDFELTHLAHVDALSDAEKLGLAISRLLEKDRQQFIDQFGELGFEIEEMLYIPTMLRNRLMSSFSLTGVAFDLDNPIVARGWDPLFLPENAARVYLEGGDLARAGEVKIGAVTQRVAKRTHFDARTPQYLEDFLYNAYLRGESIRGLSGRPFDNLAPDEQERLRTAERQGYLESIPLSDFAQTQDDMRSELESCIFILDETDAEFVPEAQRRFFNATSTLFKKAFFGHILRKFGWIKDPQVQPDTFWIPSGQVREQFFVEKLTEAKQRLIALTMAEFQMPKDFDPWHYLYLHDDVMQAAQTEDDPVRFACWHYKNFGGARGERSYQAKLPKNFSIKGYRLLNPDLDDFVEKMPEERIKGFLEIHYAKSGARENRRYNLPTEYDPFSYLLQNPDLQSHVYQNNLTLAKTMTMLAQHYVDHGCTEHRRTSLPTDMQILHYQGSQDIFVMPRGFFPIKYLLLNKDLQTAFRSMSYRESLQATREHFENFGWKEGRPY